LLYIVHFTAFCLGGPFFSGHGVDTDYTDMISVGIDLKELGGQLPKCLKLCPGIKVYGWFSLKNERVL